MGSVPAGASAASMRAPRFRGSERLALVALVGMVILAPLGPTASTVATASILLAAGVLLLSSRIAGWQLGLVVVSLALLVALSMGFANPNVPSLDVGLLGLRKSGTALLGLVIGLCFVRGPARALRVIWYALVGACAASLVLHLGFPALESGIARDADVYTSLFDGQLRLQGIFAGPFHAAMAASFILLAALPGSGLGVHRLLRFGGAGIGLWTLAEAEVRTGFVAVAAGVLMHLVLSRSARTWARAVAAAPVVLLIAILAIPSLASDSGVAAVQSLLTDPFDSRFAYRFTTWQQAISMVQERPVAGWGPGSAGDTLSAFFPVGGHVTSHSMFLKYFVEGGVIAGVMFLAICAIALVLVLRGPARKLGATAALVLLVFGLTGSSVEAIPVSVLLAAVVGLCAGEHAANLRGEVAPTTPTRRQRGGKGRAGTPATTPDGATGEVTAARAPTDARDPTTRPGSSTAPAPT